MPHARQLSVFSGACANKLARARLCIYLIAFSTSLNCNSRQLQYDQAVHSQIPGWRLLATLGSRPFLLSSQLERSKYIRSTVLVPNLISGKLHVTPKIHHGNPSTTLPPGLSRLKITNTDQLNTPYDDTVLPSHAVSWLFSPYPSSLQLSKQEPLQSTSPSTSQDSLSHTNLLPSRDLEQTSPVTPSQQSNDNVKSTRPILHDQHPCLDAQ